MFFAVPFGMNILDALKLFQASPPFQDLDSAALDELVAVISEESYAKGSTIADLQEQEGPTVRIIKHGSAKVTIPFGRNDEALIDYRGAGEMFGYLALLTGDKLRGEIAFLEDTSCYRIPRRTVLLLLQRNAEFARQFFITFLHKYVAKPHRELEKKQLFYGGGDRLLFTTAVGEIATRQIITASEDITIREASELMARNHISSLVLTNTLGFPAGIITNKDLRDKVVSKGRDTGQPVKRIQSLSLVKSESSELCIEALFKMIHYNIHHLLVLDNGRLKGIITTHDLLKLQGASPISIIREIEERQTLEELIAPGRKIRELVGRFLQEGVKAAHILRIIGKISDRLLSKLLEVTQKKVGSPPLPYCFLLCGSAGRQEQPIPTLQNSFLIFADPSSPAEKEAATAYFQLLAKMLRETMILVGLPKNLTSPAHDPAVWCQCHSLSTWKTIFSSWIDTADPAAVASFSLMFDFRILHGEDQLAEDLRASLQHRLQTAQTFLKCMALSTMNTDATGNPTDTFIIEHEGQYAGHLDLTARGIKPLVDLVRLLAIKHGLAATTTLARLQGLATISPLIQTYGEDLEYAFDVLFGFWLQHINVQTDERSDGHAYLNMAKMKNIEQKVLQLVFALIAEVRGLLMVELEQQPAAH